MMKGARSFSHCGIAVCLVLSLCVVECSISATQNAVPKPAYASLRTLPPVTSAALVTAGAMYPVDIVRAMIMADVGAKSQALPQMVHNFYQVADPRFAPGAFCALPGADMLFDATRLTESEGS
eukprot:3119856-Rhodomonas_salina.3